MKQKVYIDTSVIGGCFDKEFKEWSDKLFHEFIKGNMIAIISDVTLDELENAPEFVRNKINEIPQDFLEIIASDNECELLADLYCCFEEFL